MAQYINKRIIDIIQVNVDTPFREENYVHDKNIKYCIPTVYLYLINVYTYSILNIFQCPSVWRISLYILITKPKEFIFKDVFIFCLPKILSTIHLCFLSFCLSHSLSLTVTFSVGARRQISSVKRCTGIYAIY